MPNQAPVAERGLDKYPPMPAHERVLDHLADLLFAADETLQTLRREDAVQFRWIERDIRNIYDATNELMKKLAD